MRSMKILAALILALAPLSAAQAHGGIGIGINLGGPYFGGYAPYYYAPYPYYYYRPYPVYAPPATIIVQPAPVVQSAPVVHPAYSSPVETAPPPLSIQPAGAQLDGVEQQLQLLNSQEDRIRADAAVQLGRFKATRAVQPLTQLLSGDRSATVREASARALGLIEAPGALPALQRAAQADNDKEVRHSAQFAAESIRSNLPR